ncbi:MAG: hypothetical protein EPN23_02340 [Verrucomicrobia bacterium]|nr:MAG: hypothetical protein EPN23_02340 [Verrucomicrobiota bacterium]
MRTLFRQQFPRLGKHNRTFFQALENGAARWCALTVFAAALLFPGSAGAQQSAPHIGYVYPAGGRQGTTFEVVIGGQFLIGITNVFISGGGVQATLTDFVRPITQKELNDLRIQLDELMARRAVVRNDFRALEKFRSFKNSKTIKSDSATDDQELEAIKKKYAHATWTDADDKLLYEIRKKAYSSVRRPENPAISELAMLRVTVAADAKPGDREVRLGTPQGLTNPLLFKIGQMPEFTKPAIKTIRGQRTLKEAQLGYQTKIAKEKTETKITLPTVVNGQIMPGTVDRFRFAAQQGTHLVIAASARELIPYLADAVPGWFQATLTLYDAAGKEVAYDDDFRFNPDPVLYYEIPADGDYVLEIKDSIYRGREDFVYRITLGEMPFITSLFPLGGPAGASTTVELKGWNLPSHRLTLDNQSKAPGIYPVSVRQDDWISNFAPFVVDALPECFEKKSNGQRRTAQAVTLPIIVNGRIDHPGDRDFFTFEGKTGDQIIAEVIARRLNSPLDSELRLTDANGKQIAFNDDFEDKGSGLETHHADSYLRATLPTNGAYYLEIADTQHQGGPEFAYRLRLSAPRPDFALRLVPSSINVRIGGTVPLTVYAVRHDGFTNAIAITLKNAPKDFKLSGTGIPAGQDQVKLTLTVAPSSPVEVFHPVFEGQATINSQVVTHIAVPAEDMMQAFFYRHLVPFQDLDVAVGGYFKQKAAAKVLSALPIKIPSGGTARIQVNVPSSISYGKLEMELSDPPDGITLQKVVSVSGGSDLIVVSDATKNKPGQKGNLIVAVFLKRSGSSAKNKSPNNKQRFQATTLPAIPFEIVAP